MPDRSKRNFLRGRIQDSVHGVPDPVRPPWAIPEDEFLERCTRCSACIQACPEHIIQQGDGGFPAINFQNGECIFCQQCAESCTVDVLSVSAHKQPWSHTAHINDKCLAKNKITCNRCVDECELQSIKLNYSAEGLCIPVIDHDSCSGCGACISICPANAISPVPRQYDKP